ncbi:helix-turn-helix domain-containing protein [Pedobacter sp. MR2016-24]|uniref:helix-turn-helix domain-containing protein n=1 Tax=Pedobacter sp. MR2016-24 TaxID=2994466 RepID=UPI0022462D71|nr:helix-turn-helix domain-containing protein [Pedobacter sp. MR2016-24]MCX2485553.1 helix-turn-helix domain-containing protein [Pedobacter sp. MR2016-24]
MSLLEFYEMFSTNRPDVTIPSLNGVTNTGHFNVFKRFGYCSLNPSPYNRRDFYKISLIIGKGVLHYPNQRIEVDGTALLFNNATIPYSWETTSEFQSGYFCLFTENFMRQRAAPFHESILSKIQDNPVLFVNREQEQHISKIFERMLTEINSDYIYKYDLIRNYVNLLIHEAIKIRPAEGQVKLVNASSRIASLFFELLERQFPIYSADHVLELRTANDFAEKLSIHVNHLNHAVKEVTGKTTSEHISSRIANEAIALLKHTEWNIAEIGYSLGFEYPANFNTFFKRHTLTIPKSFREKNVLVRQEKN